MAIKDRIEDSLLEAGLHLPGARVRVVENADDSIDGEILVPIGRGEDPSDLLNVIESELRAPRGSFVTAGFRFESNQASDRSPFDQTPSGLNQQFTAFYAARNLPYAIDTAETIIDIMRDRRFRRPVQVMVRVHWNPEGEKPRRTTSGRHSRK